jgi:hypothetical protein
MTMVPVGDVEEALSFETVMRMSEDGAFLDTLVVLPTQQRGLRLAVGGGLQVTQQPVSDAPFWKDSLGINYIVRYRVIRD